MTPVLFAPALRHLRVAGAGLGRRDWLLRHAGGTFTGIHVAGSDLDAEVFAQAEALAADTIPVRTLVIAPTGQGGTRQLRRPRRPVRGALRRSAGQRVLHVEHA